MPFKASIRCHIKSYLVSLPVIDHEICIFGHFWPHLLIPMGAPFTPLLCLSICILFLAQVLSSIKSYLVYFPLFYGKTWILAIFGYFCAIWWAPWATPQPVCHVQCSIGLFAYFGMYLYDLTKRNVDSFHSCSFFPLISVQNFPLAKGVQGRQNSRRFLHEIE